MIKYGVLSEFLPSVTFYQWQTIIIQGFTNGTIGYASGTNDTNVTNIWQQILKTKYSIGLSTNAEKHVIQYEEPQIFHEFRKQALFVS